MGGGWAVEKERNFLAIYIVWLNLPFITVTILAICLRVWLAAASLMEPHSWAEGVRPMRHVFGGGRCGGCPPAQGRAVGPTAQMQRVVGVQTQLPATSRVATFLRLSRCERTLV